METSFIPALCLKYALWAQTSDVDGGHEGGGQGQTFR